jgi:gluconolactonase
MEIELRNERFAQVIDTDAKLEQVVSGYEFLEGPVWHPKEKHLIFSDIVGNTMYRWSAEDGASVFRKPSNMANGNTYDRRGRLLTCEHATSVVTRSESNGSTEIMASHYQGKELNSPNDIVVKRDGGIYFTDPNSGRGPYYGVQREQELPFQGVYRLDPQEKALTLLVDDFSKPNGLCFSKDETQLFVNDTDRNHIRVFDVQPDTGLTNDRVWAETIAEGEGVPDGMKIDRDENLYCSGPGGIHVFDKDAESLGVIRMPEQAANLTWGDHDLRSLYITASTTVYRLRTNIPGIELF